MYKPNPEPCQSSPEQYNPVIPKRFCSRMLFAFTKTADPHILAHVNIKWPDCSYPKLKMYISELILDTYEYVPVAYVTVHSINLTLITLIVAHFVGTGGFLFQYFNDHTK